MHGFVVFQVGCFELLRQQLEWKSQVFGNKIGYNQKQDENHYESIENIAQDIRYQGI